MSRKDLGSGLEIFTYGRPRPGKLNAKTGLSLAEILVFSNLFIFSRLLFFLRLLRCFRFFS